jgi:hypothetical protein
MRAFGTGRSVEGDDAIAEIGGIRIFRYRQRRWHKLVRNQLLPSGPRYGTA